MHLYFFMQASWTAAWSFHPFPLELTGSDFNSHSWNFFGFWRRERPIIWSCESTGAVQRKPDANLHRTGPKPNQTDSPTGSLFWWSYRSSGSLLPTSKHTKHFNFFYPSLQLFPFGYFIAFHLVFRRSWSPHGRPCRRRRPRRSLLCQITYTPLTFYALVLSQLNF